MFVQVWIFLGLIAAGSYYLVLRKRVDEVIFGLLSTVLWAVLALGATNLTMSLGDGTLHQQSHESVVFLCAGLAGLSLLTVLLGTGTFVKEAADSDRVDPL